MAYEFRSIQSVIDALNDPFAPPVRRDLVAPQVRRACVWYGMVSVHPGYMPYVHVIARTRREVVRVLKEYYSLPRRHRLGRRGEGAHFAPYASYEIGFAPISDFLA